MKVACIIKIHTTFLTNLALAKIVITNGSIPYDCKTIIVQATVIWQNGPTLASRIKPGPSFQL